jgi:hypothetical protein
VLVEHLEVSTAEATLVSHSILRVDEIEAQNNVSRSVARKVTRVLSGCELAVPARVGEVEAAEWALDQAKAACETEIAAALAAGVPAEKIMAAAGELASSPTDFPEDSEPAAPTADPQPR